jgi:hypothetical protein
VSALRALTADGQAVQAVVLTEEAIRVLGEAYGEIDDSDGVVGEAAAAVAEAHLEACGVARPDPARLADWLVCAVLDGSSDVTDLDPLGYADVLGSSGWPACGSWRPRRSGAGRPAGRSGI